MRTPLVYLCRSGVVRREKMLSSTGLVSQGRTSVESCGRQARSKSAQDLETNTVVHNSQGLLLTLPKLSI